MTTVAVLQARVGSGRLPGKVMYPLAGETVLSHVIERTRKADRIDDVVVAIPDTGRDEVLAREANRHGATVFRGDESDVMGRVYEAATEADASIVVRICCDNPLVSLACIDAVVARITKTDADYASTSIERTFPLGLDVEAFTMESFTLAEAEAEASRMREHVTYWYKQNPGKFVVENVTADEVYSETRLHDASDLRVTLDTPEDYELLREVYSGVATDSDGVVPVGDAVSYIRKHGLKTVNERVSQRTPEE